MNDDVLNFVAPIKEFGNSWKSGDHFRQIMKSMFPDLDVSQSTLGGIFAIIQDRLGVPPLLDPSEEWDEKSVLIYLSDIQVIRNLRYPLLQIIVLICSECISCFSI